jgi:hypothetical protein
LLLGPVLQAFPHTIFLLYCFALEEKEKIRLRKELGKDGFAGGARHGSPGSPSQ